MAASWLRRTGLVVLLGLAPVAAACADSPGSMFKRLTDEKDFISPDHQVHVEQYSKKTEDDFQPYQYQFWTFDRKRQHGSLLNPGETTDVAGYPAGFRFSRDSQWLVRMQKLGAGYHTLFLYQRNGLQFSAATPKGLGDMAWDYFYSQPLAKEIHRDPKDFDSLDHAQAHLLKGMEESYAWLGEHWPDSRYLVVSLAFDSQGEDPHLPWVEGWRCVYDMKTGEFSIPASFVDYNAKTVKFPDRLRK
jgi:hypothetical protein